MAVHRICPICGDPTTGADVDPVEGVLRCDLCGASSAIRLLPPLLFVTGASGAGKTTLHEALLGTVREAVLIDQDLLWSVDPAHDDPATGYRQFRGLVLHLAERLAKNGLPVVVEGSCTPDQYEPLGERWYFSKTAYIAVVCSDAELERRLRARRPWQESSKHLDEMLAFNRHLRVHGPTSEPTIELLDTTDRSVGACAAELHDWIRREVDVG
jgi:chloramphenicol 3-O-phosphotransferase